MKTIFAAGVLATASASASPSFAEWMHVHGKAYKTKEEVMLRKTVYAANVAKIEAHNASKKGWTMAVNKLADMTPEEFKSQLTGFRVSEKRSKNVNNALKLTNVKDLPASVDWSAQGAVTPIKNQQQCGSCWAFSTTGSVEGISFIKTGTLPSLSEQQLVDCSGAEGNQGCNGGLMDQAFQFIIDNKGITSETQYPYTAADGTCNTAVTPVATITGFTDVPVNSDTALMTAIAQQPVSVAVEADQSDFQFYSGGVMTDNGCGTQLDHGVLAVGYGTLSGQDFYKVKNSWGADWGMAGYILLGRGAAFDPSGQCGILMAASYPTKS